MQEVVRTRTRTLCSKEQLTSVNGLLCCPDVKWCFFSYVRGNSHTIRRVCSLDRSKDKRSCLALSDRNEASCALPRLAMTGKYD